MLSCIQLKESVFAVDEKVTAKLLHGTAVTVCLAVKATNIGSVANLTNELMLSDVKRC